MKRALNVAFLVFFFAVILVGVFEVAWLFYGLLMK